MAFLSPWPSTAAEPHIRVASFHTDLARDGPGLLLRDILAREAADIQAAQNAITASDADIVVLQGFDYDLGLHALSAFAEGIGADYRHHFATTPNSGVRHASDLNGDGRVELPEDGQGFGRFAGQGGMAILSRWPVEMSADFTGLRWADHPDAALRPEDPEADTRRLSSVAHWVITVKPDDLAPFALMAFHASPPVFDGPEDLNGRRNRDEILLWRSFLDGHLGPDPPTERYVILGVANADPLDGDARRDGIHWLRNDTRLQDPKPRSEEARDAARKDGGINDRHLGDPALDTANWREDAGPGNLRVDYVLPSADWKVVGSGVIWPQTNREGDPVGRHGLVWVDLRPGSAVLP